MAWLFALLGAVVIFAIAAAFVGTETFRLGHTPQAAIFDLDEAVDLVADGLPAESQARLTYDEVRALLRATLDHLASKGLSAWPGAEPSADGAQAVVVADDDAVAVVLGAAEAQGIEVDDEDVFRVITLLLDYLDRIGALGPRA